jgi:hypothetical protein
VARARLLLSARNFSWRNDGAVYEFYLKRLAPEFFGGCFAGQGDECMALVSSSRSPMGTKQSQLEAGFDVYARAIIRGCLVQRRKGKARAAYIDTRIDSPITC